MLILDHRWEIMILIFYPVYAHDDYNKTLFPIFFAFYADHIYHHHHRHHRNNNNKNYIKRGTQI